MFILTWRILALYKQYSLNKAINIFSLENLVNCTTQENGTCTGNREEGTLLNENICDSQSRQEYLKKKNRKTENSFFDLADVITGRKIVSELTYEEKYFYLTKHYCPKDQNSLLRKHCIKGGETKNLTYQLS